jgi:hypothetical protein
MKIIRLGAIAMILLLNACSSEPSDEQDTSLPWAKPMAWGNRGTFSVSSTKEQGMVIP